MAEMTGFVATVLNNLATSTGVILAAGGDDWRDVPSGGESGPRRSVNVPFNPPLKPPLTSPFPKIALLQVLVSITADSGGKLQSDLSTEE